MNGLTTISTDFEAMGKTTARLILDNSKNKSKTLLILFLEIL